MNKSLKLYIIFCSIFCTIIVTGNLIFQKFITLNIFNNILEVSVGVLLYPLTFLISDLVTEFYGKSAAKFMINVAILCSLMVLGLISVSDYCSATAWSVIDDQTFHKVFNVYGINAAASIVANYLGQLCDIYLFSYLKVLTQGKHLWFRNNVSTIVGQSVDTVIIVFILSFFDIIPWELFIIVTLSSLSFKILATLASTPFCYCGYYLMCKFSIAKIK
ncbi:MAG: queuosine precursor transporter [Rickettsiaceae bacterium]|nr:queuosine precursor transporter [Rickettsiaceae bacterium]MDP4832825.1 queuosine precursor transporter [Rickettsiaceae bacterium]MDP5083427.1 queuosine precursor transporter [Rickettsiaceae bacterium]